MTQPPPYVPATSFISYQAGQSWFPGQQLDAEFNNLEAILGDIESSLALIQRDDGALVNGSVTFQSLSAQLQNALTIGGLVPLATSLGTIRLYLGIGDSNAVGRGTAALAPLVQPGTVTLYSAAGNIVDANEPTLNAVTPANNANGAGMWSSLGNAFYNASQQKIGFVLTGQGGTYQTSAADTSNFGNWDLTGTLYPAAITAYNKAKAAYIAAGYTVIFGGVISVLGANDGDQISAGVITVGQFTTAQVAMWARLRTTFNDPELPIYQVQVGTNLAGSDTGYAAVRAAIIANVGADLYTHIPYYNMLDLLARGLMNFGAHPLQAGYNEIGASIGSFLASQTPIAFQRNGQDVYWSQGKLAVGYPVADAWFTLNPNTLPTGATTSTATPPVAAPASSVEHIVIPTGFNGVYIDGYGTTPGINMRAIGGTIALPVAYPTNTAICNLSVFTYTGAAFSTQATGFLQFRTTELQSPTAWGNCASLATSKTGGAVRAEVMRWENDGGVTVPSTVTGGSKGASTINAGGLYVGGVDIRSFVSPGFINILAKGVNLNVLGDTVLTVPLPPGITTYTLQSVQALNGSIATITTAHVGVFTAASQGGTTVVTEVVMNLTSNTPGAANSMQQFTIVNAATAFFNSATLYINVGTQQGGAATADFLIALRPGAS